MSIKKRHKLTYGVSETLSVHEMILAQGLPHKINPKFCSKRDIKLFNEFKKEYEKILKDWK